MGKNSFTLRQQIPAMTTLYQAATIQVVNSTIGLGLFVSPRLLRRRRFFNQYRATSRVALFNQS
jgi:hypothetical protein